MKDLFELHPFWSAVIALLLLLTLRAIVKYTIEFIGHTLKRPRFFSVHHPPAETAVYYVKTRTGDYEIVYYEAKQEKWRDPETYDEVDAYLWSYLPTTKAEYVPLKRHDEALEDAAESKSHNGLLEDAATK